jgi:hypothetical protein
MARVSLETAKIVIDSLMTEQERDREALRRMMNHTTKMVEVLQNMREQEERRMDTELSERKAALRSMFGQLIAAEEERRERLSRHIADIDGEEALENDLAADSEFPVSPDPMLPERQA